MAVLTNRRSVNPWFIFVLICIPIFIGSVDLTSIVVVLPQATLDLLGPKGLNKADQALWAVTAYLLAYTLSLAIVGRLSDVLPRKRVFLVCIAIFIVGSLWAGLATELPLTLLKALPIWPDPDVLPLISLVIGRVIQAIGAGASVSVGMALVSDIFPPDQRAEPISLIGALDSLGWVVGNLYAGVMLQILPSWRWIFLINAGVALVALILATFVLLRTETSRGAGRFDWRGALIFAATLTALTIGIEALKDPTPGTYLLIAACLLLAVLFINLIVGFSLILMVAGVPLIINLRSVFLRGEGLLTGALRAGITLCALTVPLIVAVLVGESRYRRIGAAVPVALGLALATVGFVSAGFWTYTGPSYVIALPLALVGIGLGLTIGPLSLVVVDAAEASARGLASSLVLMMRLLGMTFGTPLAASLTIRLANDWASERVENMGPLHDIARVMLIPPMATDALARVMLAGIAACAVGLLVFYLPRARRAVNQSGLGPGAVLHGSISLITVLVIVGALAVGDSYTTPTILHNAIAQQLPPNVTFYASINMQEIFLQNTQRPLNAVVNLLNSVPASQPPEANQPVTPSPATIPDQATATSQPSEPVQALTAAAPANPGEQATTNQPATPDQSPPANESTSTDGIIKSLFRARKWTAESYRQFCSDDLPPEQWPNCFAGSLLSWIGPQAAFALLPRTHPDYDYVFAFQVTNRNNAIQFLSNLATALGEPEPVEVGPNVRLLTINSGSPDEQRVAITAAYFLVGTPKAVQYTLNHGDLSLADQPDYQSITNRLPAADFATFYVKSSNFETDLQPALETLFNSSIITAMSRIIGQISPLAFTRNSTAPTLLGMALRIDEQQMMLDMVADLPFSLQKLNAAPVPGSLLNLVPKQAVMWAATNLNIAGLVREISMADLLNLIATNGDRPDLRALLNNPLLERFVSAFWQAFQNVLTHARGPVMVMRLPGSSQQSWMLLLPLADKENTKARTAVSTLKSQLSLLGGLSGTLAVETQPTQSGDVVTIRGKALGSALPTGFQFMLTTDNMLVITMGDTLTSLLPMLKGQGAAITEITDGLPGPLDRFVYVYADPSAEAEPVDLTALLGAQIKRQGFYLDLVLRVPSS